MKNIYKGLILSLLVLGVGLAGCSNDDNNPSPDGKDYASLDDKLDYSLARNEVDFLMETYEKDADRKYHDAELPTKFTEEQNVFMQNALTINLNHSAPVVVLPMLRGIDGNGEKVYYIITEASDFKMAKKLGVNYSPKLKYARGSEGVQKATVNGDGYMVFEGSVDFSPVRRIEPGTGEFAFPPSVAQPGAVGDENYSPIVVLPSNLVLNATPVKNVTGLHDRIPEGERSLDLDEMWVTLQILDGFQGGRAYYYHLVTDAYDQVPATIELGIYAPKLGKIPQFGQSTLDEESALLGFSPVGNGIDDLQSDNRQGLSSAILSDQNGSGSLAPLDPINVFPIEPQNELEKNNNYSPLWDAHISKWTDEAIEKGYQRRITSFQDLKSLVDKGWVVSFTPDAGPVNSYVAGLNASNAIINCPVIAHPKN
ncbi:hypothetical protein [Aureibacter tunicatorum]|uniref:Lipoprotein n=1 Tax=Aureibacter tunicatorum TaxID=866807 RepID=A0AAE4BSH9_9BACT|nr:hypothetical protein [Aureibacter tunicatorum]MDR6238858.1 hypothetical protein [Aureibacter tunicatorum]BDD05215.1 hypothetical protein AUTU_26980 [Aureibacter tunicatorum]